MGGVNAAEWILPPVAGTHMLINAGDDMLHGRPVTGGPGAVPLPGKPPDAADEAVRNARLMERRKQLGLQGRMSTFLTTAQSDQTSSTGQAPTATLLGG